MNKAADDKKVASSRFIPLTCSIFQKYNVASHRHGKREISFLYTKVFVSENDPHGTDTRYKECLYKVNS